MQYNHVSVMPKEVAFYLNCKHGKIYADCTLGGSGHAKDILTKILPDGLLIGIDQDKDAIENAKTVFNRHATNVQLFHGNFILLSEFLSQLNINKIDGILLDLGLSLHQLQASGRGFSFLKDEPLDMRMNVLSKIKAKDIVNQMDEAGLKKIFKVYGEEPHAFNIARKIVKVRKQKAIASSKQLSEIVCDAIPNKSIRKRKNHPATKVFMSLRIVVNKELERLNSFLDDAVNYLNPHGRLCVLSFHSLEDRIVKNKFRTWAKECICPPYFPQCVCKKEKIVQILTKKVIMSSKDEIAFNPMSRSARLRAVEKI